MSISTLTTKGQVTIPKDVRDTLHLHPGDQVDFSVEENGDVRLSPITRQVKDVFGFLAGKRGSKKANVRQMDRGIAGRLAKDYA